jgi:hypothetical protein
MTYVINPIFYLTRMFHKLAAGPRVRRILAAPRGSVSEILPKSEAAWLDSVDFSSRRRSLSFFWQ